MPINKGDSLPCEGICQIRLLNKRRIVSKERGTVVLGSPLQKAEELIETAMSRTHVRGGA